MVTIVGVSGSLRKGSLNTALLRTTKELASPDVDLKIVSIAAIPLYNGDDESANGLPDAVVAFKDAMASADGVLLVTPEYNNGVPGVFKNAIDWASRPAADIPKVFGDKPFAVIGASPGGFGTILSQNAWLPILRTLGVRFWAGDRLLASRAHQAFDENGALTDEALRGRLAAYVAGFAAFVKSSAG